MASNLNQGVNRDKSSTPVSLTISPIALLGTSADPPTYGHESLLKELSKLFPKVITWASDNPMKKHYASLSQRHKLLQALVKDLDLPQIELRQELSSPQTIKTLEIANELWPWADLVFIIGSDLAKQIPTWVQSQDLFSKVRLGIALREGWPLNNNDLKELQGLGANIDLLPFTIPASSSSNIRNYQTASQIPKSILPIILKERLYGLSK